MNCIVIAESKQCIGCNTYMAACILAHKMVGLVDQPRLYCVGIVKMSHVPRFAQLTLLLLLLLNVLCGLTRLPVLAASYVVLLARLEQFTPQRVN